MSEKDYEPDDVEPGLSEGDVHSGPGGYEGMGYQGGYASEYFSDEENEDESNDDDDAAKEEDF
jgi:hypothetical protein